MKTYPVTEVFINSSKLSHSMNFCRIPSLLFRLPGFGLSGPSPSRSSGFSLLLLAALLLSAAPALAQGTKLWTQSRFDEFEKGTPDGVQITSDGKLRSGPSAHELLTTPSSFVWSVATDKAGIVYLATGSPATVLRVNPEAKGDDRWVKLFETKAVAVQVLRVGPDGALYAATMPDGKVYRLKPDAAKPLDESTAEVVFDLSKIDSDGVKSGENKADDGKTSDNKTDSKNDNKARYIWDMTFDTGGGAVYSYGRTRVGVSNQCEPGEARRRDVFQE